MKKAEPRAIAKQLIKSAEAKGISVTNLKIQKLLYFAHGLSLVINGRPLLSENFQAWKYGPVVPSLYHELKIFGQSSLKLNSGFIKFWPDIPDPEERSGAENVVNLVLDQLGPLTGAQLVDISHNAQGPWHAVYHSGQKDIKIEDAAIKSYFKTIVKNQPAV